MTSVTLSGRAGSSATRAALLVSLALNVFLISAGAAIVARHYWAPNPTATIDRSAGGRIERIAATLPTADAEILRGAFRTRQAAVQAAQDAYRGAQERVSAALRGNPFDTDALRAAMGETRAARQVFDRSLQDVLAEAAAKMSPAARDRLAEWPARTRAGVASGR